MPLTCTFAHTVQMSRMLKRSNTESEAELPPNKPWATGKPSGIRPFWTHKRQTYPHKVIQKVTQMRTIET